MGNVYTTDSRNSVCDISKALRGNRGPHIHDDDLYTIFVHPRMGPIEHANAETHTTTMINRVRLCVIIFLKGLTIEKYLCILMAVSVKIDEANQKGTTNPLNLQSGSPNTQACLIIATIMNGMQNKQTPIPVTASCVRNMFVRVRI